jgi:hypothetical protein
MSRDVVLGTIAGTFGAAAGLFTKLTLGGLPEQPGPLMVPVYALLPADLPGAGFFETFFFFFFFFVSLRVR